MPRSQDDHRAGCDVLVGNTMESVSSEKTAKNHEDLQHRIVTADAAPWSTSEGQIGEGRPQLVVPFGKALRVETLWTLPVARCVVRAIHIDNDRRSAGYVDVPCAVVRHSHAVDHPKRRIEAEPLLNDLRGEFELVNVAVTQRRFAQHGIKLLPHPFQAIRTRAQKIEKPG